MTEVKERSTTVRARVVSPLAAIVLALAAAIFGAGPAHAATWTSGHIDVVYAEATSATNLTLRTHPDPGPSVPAGTWDIAVPHTPALGGYVLPESYSDSVAYDLPFAGFGGSSNLISSGAFSPGDTLALRLDSVVHTNPNGTPGTGTVTVSHGGTTWYDGAGDRHDFSVRSGSSAFHEHAKWVFSAPGTYELKFYGYNSTTFGSWTGSTSTYTFVVS
ncbi:TIGR03769 domain-containing protein [Streptomyces marincola]|uniref:TIGR03769 domain-containing protein n=1 Tax=Streptomyces marincola TaxID=2878388 RepID=UPI001CF25E49|nr:TIGR03769 domain-containing protein [Streptomyces marincola]UCM89348.1 TIGR03769 domain-containing protein [Streptomyces marincola]